MERTKHLCLVFLLSSFLHLLHAKIFVHENVLFEKVNEVSSTRSKWLVAMSEDLNSYYDIINELNASLRTTKLSLMKATELDGYLYRFDTNITDMSLFRILNFFNLVTHEINNLDILYISFTNDLNNYRLLHGIRSRSKRALIPIIGKALGYLFGTISEDDLGSIRKNIRNLARSQQGLKKIVKQGLTVLKRTREQVLINSRTINDIISSIRNLSINVQVLSVEVDNLKGYMQMYTVFDRALADTRDLISLMRERLNHLNSQLNMLSLGHLSPSVVGPYDLQKMLLEIKSHLDPKLRLPYDPVTDLWSFYQSLTCVTFVEEYRIITVISVPLIDTFQSLEIYKIINLPVPRAGSNQTNILATYALETNAIAIDKKRSIFAPLTQQELGQCSKQLEGYCQFASPFYTVKETRMCILLLFMNRLEQIPKYCQTITKLNSLNPMAMYLSEGRWFITTSEPITFSILCNMTTNIYTTTIPIDIMYLRMGCSGYSGQLSLPPFYQKESQYNITNAVKDFLDNFRLEKQLIWQPFTKKFPKLINIKIPQKIQIESKMPIQTLINEIDQDSLDLYDMSTSPWVGSIYFYITIAGIMIAIIVIMFLFRRQIVQICSKFGIQRSRKNNDQEREPSVSSMSNAIHQSPDEHQYTRGPHNLNICRLESSEKYSEKPQDSLRFNEIDDTTNTRRELFQEVDKYMDTVIMTREDSTKRCSGQERREHLAQRERRLNSQPTKQITG